LFCVGGTLCAIKTGNSGDGVAAGVCVGDGGGGVLVVSMMWM